jgi:hypothetical protein
MDKTAKFRKIPLKNLIDTLVVIYNSGADYVDILGRTGNPQDIVTISVIQEYMASQEKDVPESRSLLTDEDIDNLLNQ